MRQINDAGLSLIKEFEGYKLTAYQDEVGVWTIGWGCTAGVTEGMVITDQQAVDMLNAELAQFENDVTNDVTVDLNDNEFAALVSFAYNLGNGSLHGSTLLRLLNAGDRAGAAAQFPLWDHAGHVVDAGLLRRRNAEMALFLTPVDGSGGLPPAPSDDDILNDLKSHE